MFRGALTSAIGQAPINFVVFGTYGSAARSLERSNAASFVGVPESHSKIFHAFLAGSYAGFAQSFLRSPVEHVKVQQQLICADSESPKCAPGTQDTVRAIFRAGGVRHLMRGWLATSLRDTPALGVYFGSYEYTKKTLSERYSSPPLAGSIAPPHASNWVLMTAGAIAGFVSWAIVLPVDVVKSLVQGSALSAPHSETAFLTVASRLYAKGGVALFYRGFVPCVLRAVPVNATIFLGYEWSLKMLTQPCTGIAVADCEPRA